MTKPRGISLATVALATVVCAATLAAGCGEKSESTTSGEAQSLDLALDFYVNPDHAGIYEALDRGYFRQAGLDVHPQVPSDPSAPIKEVAAGRADLAISYEPEVLIAHDAGLPVKAVAAVVPTPLTSLIWLKGSGIRSVKDLRGKTIATAGIPYQAAYLDAILQRAGLSSEDVNQVDVQQGLLPAILSGRADAMLGGFLNVEGVDLRLRGKDPTVIPVDRLGIPTYNELVVVANSDRLEDQGREVELFLAALLRGTKAAAADPASATKAILDAGKGLDPRVTAAQVRKTLPLLVHRGKRPYGYMDPGQWTRFAHFFADHGVIKALPIDGRRADERLPAGRNPLALRGGVRRRSAEAGPDATAFWKAASTNEPASPAVWRIGSEELLHLLDRRAAPEAGQATDQLDVRQVAGGQRVDLAAPEQPEALHGPRPDLANREQAAIVRGVRRIDPARRRPPARRGSRRAPARARGPSRRSPRGPGPRSTRASGHRGGSARPGPRIGRPTETPSAAGWRRPAMTRSAAW